ncbi:DUF4032 domain-containing protein [Isoptericola sp. NEAU-Y5]|uniref:DUF4032 domain-containing protein n=1 Tax=Isoptericola luteus TaxID=2879484 RepID=A0ABS7ZDB8_9MICO|nr:DUF4032 domain-containing protein [Isoptericola sp. NEAU-Y5]MCA5893043.1 DUF4032 domain-containing protein [Isoptericola sp. NEAU-Y5]
MDQLQITSATPNSALLDLPWRLPLAEWPDEVLAALPRGISRHVVRFVRLDGRVLAIKEISEHVAFREFGLLRQLNKLEIPGVVPVGVVTGRRDDAGEPLEAALVTEHLAFSLPYRAVFSQSLRPDTATRLIDALAVLLVRLHLVGFYWGDVSLSNTLFRRDAHQFAAYLVDAETGALHRELSPKQREYDLDLARTNIIGELMDLAAGELLDDEVDEIGIGDALVSRYAELWEALTGVESFDVDERWRVEARIARLNQLGFDVGELSITTDIDGTTVRIRPQVVDAGHHSRRLFRLTGLDVQDNQARRLLNDLDSYRAATDRQDEDEPLVAHDWLQNVFHPTIRAVPRDLRRKLEPAQLYHEILDHRWFISEQAGRDVPMPETVASYVDNVLRHRPDEKAILGLAPGEKDPELDDDDVADEGAPEDDHFHLST